VRKGRLAAFLARRYLERPRIRGHEQVASARFPRLRSSATGTRSPGPPLTLSSYLTEERIKVPLDSLDKPAILREMCCFLASAADVPDRAADIHRVVVEREEVLSTGVGDGLALPHGKCRGLETLEIVAGTTRKPIDFDSMDGGPVRLVVLMVGPPSAAGSQVKALGHLSRTLRDTELLDRLVNAEDAGRFHELIVAAGA